MTAKKVWKPTEDELVEMGFKKTDSRYSVRFVLKTCNYELLFES